MTQLTLIICRRSFVIKPRALTFEKRQLTCPLPASASCLLCSRIAREPSQGLICRRTRLQPRRQTVQKGIVREKANFVYIPRQYLDSVSVKQERAQTPSVIRNLLNSTTGSQTCAHCSIFITKLQASGAAQSGKPHFSRLPLKYNRRPMGRRLTPSSLTAQATNY